MATLIAVYNSEGCVGRCDAKCYNAIHPHCDCICGGANHGVGFQKGMNNTREIFGLDKLEELLDTWVEQYADTQKRQQYTAVVPDSVLQLSLF
jgi:hypothetical protein